MYNPFSLQVVSRPHQCKVETGNESGTIAILEIHKVEALPGRLVSLDWCSS